MTIFAIMAGLATFSAAIYGLTALCQFMIFRVSLPAWMAFGVAFIIPAFVGSAIGSLVLTLWLAGVRP